MTFGFEPQPTTEKSLANNKAVTPKMEILLLSVNLVTLI